MSSTFYFVQLTTDGKEYGWNACVMRIVT